MLLLYSATDKEDIAYHGNKISIFDNKGVQKWTRDIKASELK